MGVNTYRLKYIGILGEEHLYPRTRSVVWYLPNLLTILWDGYILNTLPMLLVKLRGEITKAHSCRSLP